MSSHTIDSHRITGSQFTDAKTNAGQPLRLQVRIGKAALVKRVLARLVVSAWAPEAHKVNLEHGSYGRYSRYNITQHEYAGGHGGYIELLEIHDAPDGRGAVVINNYSVSGDSNFTEWKTLAAAQAAFDQFFNRDELFQEQPGFIRRVPTGALTPWFYAVGDQDLISDYAVPADVQDDPEFVLGETFVVFEDELPRTAVCLGTRFIAKHEPPYRSCWNYRVKPENVATFRLVYFEGGYIWDERQNEKRPIKADAPWIAEAMQQFKAALAGERTDINIQFKDGTSFIGRFTSSKITRHSRAGDYELKATLVSNGDQRVTTGWMNGFVPTAEYPDIISYTNAEAARKGTEVRTIQVLRFKSNGKTKKWSGLFFDPPTA